MENIQPFEVGEKIICVKDFVYKGEFIFRKNDEFMVVECKKFCSCGYWSVRIGVSGFAGTYCPTCLIEEFGQPWFRSFYFRKINPYSNSVSQELAEKAMEVNIEIDVPVKREVVNN